MKTTTAPRIADDLARMACAHAPGKGETALLFQAAARINELENRLRETTAIAIYLRTTCADVARLLAGQQVTPFEIEQDLTDLARAKAEAVCRATAAAKLEI